MIIVCTGGRDHKDRDLVYKVLNELSPKAVIVGDCPTGVDLYVREWCSETNANFTVFKADWDQHMLAAGPLRNQEMINFAYKLKAVVIAFRGNKGTRDCTDRARMRKMIVLEAK